MLLQNRTDHFYLENPVSEQNCGVKSGEEEGEKKVNEGELKDGEETKRQAKGQRER